MKKYICMLALLFMLSPAVACADPINVFVSILPQKFFLDQIGKGNVKVTVMVKPGANPAVYEPKPSQMVELAKTDIYFAIGVPFETAWLPKIQDSNPKMLIVHTDANVPKIPITGHYHYDEEGNVIDYHGGAVHVETETAHADHDHDGHDHATEGDHDHDAGHDEHEHGETEPAENEILDPHIWLDPALVKIQGRNIADALQAFDPDNADFYEQNYADFIVRVDQVDAQVREKLKGLEGITFMTFHPAWGYFAKAYGMHQLTVEVGGREPSPAQLKDLMEQAKAASVKVIFVQPQFDQKHARTVQKALKIKLLIADPLEMDWSMCLLQQANRLQRVY